MGAVRVGIGGWSYAPWRGVFYPPGLRQADELAYASAHLRTLEINATFQSFQRRETFARWAEQTPADFVFTLKAHRVCVNRKQLAGAGEAIESFLGQGLDALGDRLGPILWALMPTKAFDAGDMAAFLDLLPETLAGRRLRHAIEARHPSFADPAFVRMCRRKNAAVCLVDHPDHPAVEAPADDFAYVRLMRGTDEIETGYPPAALDDWARRLRALASDGRDVFAFFINAGKLRAPAAAMALTARLDQV